MYDHSISASSNNFAIVSSLTDRTIYNSKHLWYFLFYIPEMFRYKLKNSQLQYDCFELMKK